MDLTEAASDAKRGELERAEQDISRLAVPGMLDHLFKCDLFLGLLVNKAKARKLKASREIQHMMMITVNRIVIQ